MNHRNVAITPSANIARTAASPWKYAPPIISAPGDQPDRGRRLAVVLHHDAEQLALREQHDERPRSPRRRALPISRRAERHAGQHDAR